MKRFRHVAVGKLQNWPEVRLTWRPRISTFSNLFFVASFAAQEWDKMFATFQKTYPEEVGQSFLCAARSIDSILFSWFPRARSFRIWLLGSFRRCFAVRYGYWNCKADGLYNVEPFLYDIGKLGFDTTMQTMMGFLKTQLQKVVCTTSFAGCLAKEPHFPINFWALY